MSIHETRPDLAKSGCAIKLISEKSNNEIRYYRIFKSPYRVEKSFPETYCNLGGRKKTRAFCFK